MLLCIAVMSNLFYMWNLSDAMLYDQCTFTVQLLQPRSPKQTDVLLTDESYAMLCTLFFFSCVKKQ